MSKHYVDKDDAFCKAWGSVQMGLLDKYNLLLLPKNEFYSMYSFIFKHFCDLYYREHSLIKDVELNHSGEQMLEKLVRELFQVSKNFD